MNLINKHFPFEFHQADAMTYPLEGFDVIHASPECQEYSITRSLKTHIFSACLPEVRIMLKLSGLPYVIENVPGAPMENYLILCGTMFGLRVIRHRWFECNPIIMIAPATCNHAGKTQPNSKTGRRSTPTLDKYRFLTVTGHDYKADDGRLAMGIDWMTKKELSKSVPPAYTLWIGQQLMEQLCRS